MMLVVSVTLIVLVLMMIWGLVLEDRICREVRSKVPEVWRQLGSPERYIDDGGLARRAALARLIRNPVLLAECPDQLARQIWFMRAYSRVCLLLGLVAFLMTVGYVLYGLPFP